MEQKLSKKEENESRKIHARHMAEQKVAITKRTSKRTIRDFLLDIAFVLSHLYLEPLIYLKNII